MALPPLVTRITTELLDATDVALPRPLAALYLYGSTAMGDFRPGSSDLDMVAVLSEPADDTTLGILADVHTALATRFPDTDVDGVYVTWDELADGPRSVGPHAYGGAIGVGGFERLWVTWHGLAQSGVVVRGPRLSSVPIATNPAALAAWVSANLEDYWRAGWRAASTPGTPEHEAALAPESIMWTVLGVMRLYYTLETGSITSKTGAGEYALQSFEERWHPIVREALAIRDGSTSSLFSTPEKRRTAMLDFCDMVIDGAPSVALTQRPPAETG